MNNESVDQDDEDMKYEEEKESQLSSLSTIEQKFELKKYFENLSDEELNKKFKYYLYNSLIENTFNSNTLFSKLRDFNHKKKKIYQKHRLSRVSEAIDLQILIEEIYPLFHLDINICLITCEYSYEPIINVLAIDHKGGPSVHGKYFHFNYVDMEMYCNINEERGQRFKVYIKRTKYTGNVIIWLSNGGGSRGNAHGRFDKDPLEAIGSGYFKVGDQIQIIQRL